MNSVFFAKDEILRSPHNIYSFFKLPNILETEGKLLHIRLFLLK